MTTETGGKIDNKGDLTTDHFTVNGGTVVAGDGSITSKDTHLNGGDFIVGNEKELSDANRVVVNLAGNDKTGSNLFVIGNGDLSFGAGADKLADSLQAPGFSSEHASRVTVDETVKVGTGSIAVGSGVWKSESDKLALNPGDLFFGKNSYTLVDAGTLGDKAPAFTTDTAGAKVTVEQGATLVLGNVKANGDYVITGGFATAGNETDGTWTGGWTGDNLYALPLSNTGIGWDLAFHHDADKSWVHATLQDVKTVYPDIVVPDNTNDSLNNGKPENGGADKFIHDTLSDPNLSKDDKTRQINSVANMSSASGALETAFDDLGQTTDAVEDHLSFKGEHFNHAGYLARGAKGSALWVNVLGGWKKSKSLSADGNMEGGNKNDSYGFVLGADYVPQAGKTTFGAALAYTDGSVKSNGDWLSTSTDTKSYSLTSYGNWTPNDKVNVVGSVTMQKGKADATQSLIGGGFNEATASVDTTLVSAAFRAEYRHSLGKVALIPHAGARAVYAKTDGYDTKVDGEKVFGNDVGNSTQVQFPIGLAVRGEFGTKAGWKVRPTGDVTLTAVMGDTDQTTKVSGNRCVTDSGTGEFSGKFVTSLNLGLQAEKAGTTFGVGLGINKGDSGRQDVNVKLQMRHAF